MFLDFIDRISSLIVFKLFKSHNSFHLSFSLLNTIPFTPYSQLIFVSFSVLL